jgi:gliding motility-associated-like protein
VLCPGGEVSLTATATPGPAAYAWSTGATTPAVRVRQPGTYRVTATFPDGLTRTAEHQVSAFAATLRIGGDTVLCAGQPLELSAVTAGATAYAWSTGATTPTIRVTQAGTVALEVTYAGGCTAQARVEVRPPVALAGFSLGNDTALCAGTQLVLRVPALGGVRHRWSDGSTGPTLTVHQAGEYSLTLTGCETRVLTRRVAVQACVAIPNVITPNGDGQNDRFRIAGLAGAGWHLTVYNRWGQAVYQAANYLGEWGEHAAPGLYYYALRHPGTNALYKGWVEAIR